MRDLLAEEAGAEADDVGVVVLAGEAGGREVVDGGGADAGRPCSPRSHTPTPEPHTQHAELGLAARHRSGHRDAEVGVVDPLLVSGAEVDDLVASAPEAVGQELLER